MFKTREKKQGHFKIIFERRTIIIDHHTVHLEFFCFERLCRFFSPPNSYALLWPWMIGRQVRLLCPRASHLNEIASTFEWARLVVSGGNLTRRSQKSLRCILVEVLWQIRSTNTSIYKVSQFCLLSDSFGFLGETGPSRSCPLWTVPTTRSQSFVLLSMQDKTEGEFFLQHLQTLPA